MAIGLRSDAGLISERTPTLSPIDLAHLAARIARILGRRRQLGQGRPFHVYDDGAKFRIVVDELWPEPGAPLTVRRGDRDLLRLTGLEVGWVATEPAGWRGSLELLAQLADRKAGTP